MSQKFIVLLHSGTAPQRDAITSLIHGKGWDDWHWIDDAWFLNDIPADVTPRSLWEELVSSDPTLTAIRGLVLKVSEEIVFWGGNDTKSWPWLSEKWGKADFPKPSPPPAPTP